MKKTGNIHFIVVGLAIIGVALIFAMAQTKIPGTTIPILPGENPLDSKVIPHFSSEQEIVAAFSQAQQNGLGQYAMRDNIMTPTSASTGESKSDSSGGAGGNSPAPSYSNTNVQVEGVDEADIVKTDGKYIYSFYKNKLVITLAYPAEDARVVKTLNLDTITPSQLFVNGNKLVVFGTSYAQGPFPYASEKMAAPGWGGEYIYPPYWNYSKSIVNVYDISDKENPALEKELSFTGNYVSSRMIENQVYFVMQAYPDYQILNSENANASESIIPPYFEDGVEKPLAAPQDIGYLRPIYAQSFVTIGSLNLNTKEFTKETIVGSAETVYASEENLYISHTQWNYYYGGPMPLGIAVREGDTTVSAGNDSSTDDSSPADSSKPSVDDNVPKTIIHKFSLKNGNVSYEGKGIALGHVLNQFSMDEYAGNVRIATTIDGVWNERTQKTEQSSNNVYVFNEDMEQVGALEDLAPGERIYSARFMGERAYLVTFRQIDPLFVLDLSNPEEPKVLGKLKIPGYSDYLHPIDATHLMGVGKDTETSKSGDFAYYLGMKLAIFDVSDVENPLQMHSLIIGDRGTDSFALQDHHAFLYDAEKNLLVLPIYLHEISVEQKNNIQNGIGDWQNWPAYGEPVFQGAFVYTVTLENGFEERGRITHIDNEIDLKSGYYLDWQYQVKRSLFINDVLYTISDKVIKANALSDLREIKTIPYVVIPNDLKITARVEGSFCAGPCSYQEVQIDKLKIKQTNFTGEDPGYTNSYENPAYSQYDDVVENLDWSAFKALDNTLGCPGCADGSVETISITDGKFTKTIRMEAGMEVKEIQPFLNAIRMYTGLGGIYYGTAYATGSSSGIVIPETAVGPAQ